MQNSNQFSGYVSTRHSLENSDLDFKSWEGDNFFSGSINYIFSLHNFKILNDFLSSKKIDIIHLHGFFASLSPSVLLAIRNHKRRSTVKVIQTLHDFHLICPNGGLYNYSENKICERCVGRGFKPAIILNNCDRRGWSYSFIKGIRSFVSNNLLKHRDIIDHFICPSEFLKSKLISDHIDPEKISVVRNPIQFSGEEPKAEKKNIICYFGRFSKEKNLNFLIESFSLWKTFKKNDFRLFFIGEGEEEESLRKEAGKSIWSKDISFFKYLPFSELRNILSEVKYLSLSSECYENAPMNIIEAFSLNILSLAPDLGGMRESIESVLHCGMIYKSGNRESWIEALNSLEENYSFQINELIRRKKDILDSLSTENYLNALRKIYSA